MKHIITSSAAHVWDAGCRIPDAQPMLQEEHVWAGQPKKKATQPPCSLLLGVERGWRTWKSFGLYASTVKSFLTCHEAKGRGEYGQGFLGITLTTSLGPKWP